MYTSFTIENFRLFDDITIEPLARVNLIAGDNNVGKTALLEALWLHSGPNAPDLCLRISGFRGIMGVNPQRLLHDIFHDFDYDREITLSALGNWGDNNRVLKITSRVASSTVATIPTPDSPTGLLRVSQANGFSALSSSEIVFDYTDENTQLFTSTGLWARSEANSAGPLPNFSIAGEGLISQNAPMPKRPAAVFLSARQRRDPEEDAMRLGEAELAGNSEQIVDCLKQVDPRIKRLTTISAPPSPMVYADIGLSRPIPVGFLGDGMGRLLTMVLSFYETRNGMMLIDEIENGLHHSKLKGIWQHLHRLSREFNVQVFATTHSYECVKAAHNAFKLNEIADELSYIRLQRNLKTQRLECVAYADAEVFDYALEYGREVR